MFSFVNNKQQTNNNTKHKTQNTKHKTQNTKHKTQNKKQKNKKNKTQNTKHKTQNKKTKNTKQKTKNKKQKTKNKKQKTKNTKHKTQNTQKTCFNQKILGFVCCYSYIFCKLRSCTIQCILQTSLEVMAITDEPCPITLHVINFMVIVSPVSPTYKVIQQADFRGKN